MYTVMKGLMGQCPLQNLWARTTPRTKKLYNNCCQMSFFPLTIHRNRCRLGLRPPADPRSLQLSPDPQLVSKGRLAAGGNGGREGRTSRRVRRKGKGKGGEEGGKKGDVGGIAPWLLGGQKPLTAGAFRPNNNSFYRSNFNNFFLRRYTQTQQQNKMLKCEHGRTGANFVTDHEQASTSRLH